MVDARRRGSGHGLTLGATAKRRQRCASENMNALQQLSTAAGKINVNGKQLLLVFDLA